MPMCGAPLLELTNALRYDVTLEAFEGEIEPRLLRPRGMRDRQLSIPRQRKATTRQSLATTRGNTGR